MTTSTITPAEWEAFADATVTHDQAAREMGRHLAARTPPVALAKRARHRKPNRRRNVIAKAGALLVLIAAIFAAMSTARAHVQAPAPYLTPAQLSQVATVLEAPGYVLTADVTGTAAEDYAACAAVYHFHHMNAIDYGGRYAAETERAWWHAWHLAGYADQLRGDSMRYHIRYYLDTGTGWSLVAYDCQPDA